MAYPILLSLPIVSFPWADSVLKFLNINIHEMLRWLIHQALSLIKWILGISWSLTIWRWTSRHNESWFIRGLLTRRLYCLFKGISMSRGWSLGRDIRVILRSRSNLKFLELSDLSVSCAQRNINHFRHLNLFFREIYLQGCRTAIQLEVVVERLLSSSAHFELRVYERLGGEKSFWDLHVDRYL